MQIPEGERVAVVSRRWVIWLAVAGAALVAVGVPVALASHQFADVPNASPHHDDISAIAGAGITGGCAPGLYCPTDAVRRDQMGSFLRRGLGRVGASGTTAGVALTTTFQTIASDSITSGGAAGGSGFVVVMGNFTAINNAGSSLTDSERIEFQIVESGTGFTSNISDMTLDAAGAAFPSATGHKQWIFSIPTATTRTYSLQARLAFAPIPGTATINAESRLVIVMYVPFGSSGTSSLGGTLGTAEASSSGSGPDLP